MKSKAHIYMANLIMDEVTKNGRVTIGETEYAVPKKVLEVINKYPDYVRAGSVGPDFFPDLITGQMIIHPTDSGKIINLMWDELTTLKEGANYDQAFAFYLGFTLHYACDMFSHYYINKYAGGFFPDISSIVDEETSFAQKKEAISIILKHITLESYMDQKIMDKRTSMNIPKKYLMRCFGTMESWQRINHDIYGDSNIKPEGFNILYGMVKEYSDALKSSRNIISRKSQELQERIDIWMTEWQKFVTQSIAGNAKNFDFSTIETIIRDVDISGKNIDTVQALIYAYQIVNGPLPIILNILKGKYLDPLYWLDKAIREGIKLAVLKTILKILHELLNINSSIPSTTSKCKEEIADLIWRAVDDPKWVIDETPLFKEDSNYFNNEWGNFGELIDCQSQTFDVFRRCLNMGKLCLVGNNNLIKIAKNYDAGDYSDTFKDGVLSHKVSKILVTINVARNSSVVNCDVHLTIAKKNRDRYRYYLDSLRNDFRAGQKYEYIINFDKKLAISDIALITLGCDFTSWGAEFKIDRMTVADMDSDEVLIDQRNIIVQRDKPYVKQFNESSENPWFYKLNIHTSTTNTNNGKDVFLIVRDKYGNTDQIKLENEKDNNFAWREGDDFIKTLNHAIYVADLKEFEISCNFDTNVAKLGLKNIKITDASKNIILAAPGGEYTIKKNKPLVIPVNANELVKKYK